MIVVVARCLVKKECKDEFITAAQEMISASRKEKGNISYTLMQDLENEDAVAFIEEWEDLDAIEEHGVQLHFKEGIQRIRELMESMEVIRYEEI